MSCLDWRSTGGRARATPWRYLHRPGRYLAVCLLASVAILQCGCTSGPLANCGSGSGLFSPCGFFGRVSNRVFNRGNSGCCGSGAVTDGTVEYAAPAAGATTVVPSYPSGSSMGTPSAVSPGASDSPDLNPLSDPPTRSKVVSPPNGGGGSTSSSPSTKTSFATRRYDSGSRIARRRIENLPKTTLSTPEPTSRSAQAVSQPSALATSASDQENALDHLPPLDLPGEVTRSSAPPVAAPAAAGDSTKKLDLRNEPPAPPAASPEPASAPAAAPAPEPMSLSTTAPGFARFAPVDLKLAGGSAPSPAGLDWLVEKGYRTVLDLRESSEVPPSFIAEVTNRGLRYVALPIGLKSIDRDHVGRFNYELAAGDARPLYFFDHDGTRAGALWYIRRIANDHVDHQIARREAEELGLKNQSYWKAATSYVAGLAPSQASAVTNQNQNSVPAGVKSPNTSAAQPTARPASIPTAQQPASSGGTGASLPSTPPPASAKPQHAAGEPTLPADPYAWRPFAAVVVTGLSLPLAYWTRSLGSTALAKARASLPALAHRQKALPGESGA
jgi:protein tyrosine phosphatase (PTP) superfamily phosphohydrolase (DUF442 family)